MFIRAPETLDKLLNGVAYRDVVSRANLYPTAFPFNKGIKNSPASCVPVTLHGQAAGVTSEVDLWPQNANRTFPTSAFTLAVSSGSTDDVKTSGTGAWTVEVDVLDTAYAAHTITLNLNGRTKVSDTLYVAGLLRVNDIRVTDVGTGLKNAGVIYAYDASDTVTNGVPQTATKIFGMISVGDNIARGAFYTVPAGCEMQIDKIRGGFNETSVASRSGIMVLRQHRLVGTKRIAFDMPIAGQITNSTGAIQIDLTNRLVVPEKTDITIRATASAASTIFIFADATLYTKEP
jgi:hypothetical protein